MAGRLENLSGLEEAILKIIVFFDMFSYPLTAYELWRYLSVPADFSDTEAVAKTLAVKGYLGSRQGFYFLPGQDSLISVRKQRYHYTNRKLKIARRAVRLFRLLPTVEFAALSNLIGRHNLRDGSDIDIFIISKENRIWITRLFCAGLMKLLRQRPTPEKKRDKICLSFYVDGDHLDLSSMADGDDDYYFHFWLAGLYPLYDAGAYHHQLMQANVWLKKYLPNGDFVVNNQSYRESPRYWLKTRLVLKFWRKSCDYLEKLAARLQMRIMPAALKDKANLDSRVIIKPGILKLYLVDRRREFARRYQERLRRLFHVA
ncbi:MAG: hypothetical protein PHG95_03340 [Patescibacteria group bacterium]|nr:hypothetical protein [Patescibacteria group bacterium]